MPRNKRPASHVPSQHVLTARFLRAHRVAAGISQRELARRAGVAQVTISHLETGKVATLQVLVRLARALGTTAQNLRAYDALAETPTTPTATPPSSAA